MMLSDKAVNEFRELAKKNRGIELSEPEARTMATKWLKFFALVYKPMKNEENKKPAQN
jgi:hypothetical protein